MKTLQIGNMPELSHDMVEAFNRLRVNLNFCEDKPKVIMVTSSVPDEGKSFVAMQLWKQMADIGTPTLLMDCSLYNSDLCKQYGIGDTESIIGITNYLAGRAELDEVLYQTNIPNGYILPSETSANNPSTLIANKRFGEAIDTCKEKFGYVIIDTPSISAFADVLNIASHCDGTVLVAQSASTPRDVVSNSVQAIKRTGSPLLGIVLNRVDMKNKVNRYRYQHFHSGC